MLRARFRWLLVASVIVGAFAAGGAAAFAPAEIFDAVLATFIGQPGPAATTLAQRLIAIVGAALGAIATVFVILRGAPRVLSPKPRRTVVLVHVVLAGLLMVNALTLVHRLGAFRGVYPPRWSFTALAIAVSVGCTWFLASPEPKTNGRARSVSPWIAGAAGAGYGCFSGLWHCCPPWWRYADWSSSSIDVLWFTALAVTLGAIGRVAASTRVGLGESLGAVVFAVTYPWHTVLFFTQNLIGGAFATALVRVTGSGWAPALFLGTAYLTHTTLPFVGPSGVVVACALLATCVVLAVREGVSGSARPGRAVRT